MVGRFYLCTVAITVLRVVLKLLKQYSSYCVQSVRVRSPVAVLTNFDCSYSKIVQSVVVDCAAATHQMHALAITVHDLRTVYFIGVLADIWNSNMNWLVGGGINRLGVDHVLT